MSTANKLTIIGLLITAIGVIVSIIQVNKNEQEALVSQSTTGNKSPTINSNGNVNLNIK